MESGVTTCTSYSSRQHDITINQLRGCRWEISSHERFSICGFPGGPRTSGNEQRSNQRWRFPHHFPNLRTIDPQTDEHRFVCGDSVSSVMTPLLHILSTMEDRW